MTPIASPYDNDLANLHPAVRFKYYELAKMLEADGLPFFLFEGYRSPQRQDELALKVPAVTNARAWQSAHQVGLAGDFVGVINGAWSWRDDLPWGELKIRARRLGLDVPIRWDKPHVEATTLWQELRSRIRK